VEDKTVPTHPDAGLPIVEPYGSDAQGDDPQLKKLYFLA